MGSNILISQKDVNWRLQPEPPLNVHWMTFMPQPQVVQEHLLLQGIQLLKKKIIYQPAILNAKTGEILCTVSKTHSKYLNFCQFSEHYFI
jgi:hypothetical protein